jgi:hypothetical protein
LFNAKQKNGWNALAEYVLNFLGDAHRPDQKINQALKKRRLMALDEMRQEQQDPSPSEKAPSQSAPA